MIKILLLTCLLAITTIVFSQSHWESVVLESDTWKYYPATSEPTTAWQTLGFNDTAWESAPGGIGYADDDDLTTISAVNSLYLRKTFTVSNTALFKNIILDIDYDDAFVAYINGVEVARSQNITANPPLYNSPLTDYREAIMYQGMIPERYTLDVSMLNNGNNVLSVHIINYSYDSSDLSSRVFLNAEIDGDNIIYNNTPSWFIAPAEPIELTSSNLPIIIINTNNQTIVDDPKIIAHMGIINNGKNTQNNINDTYTDYNGQINIEIRGESSQMFPKTSYLFETQDELGENNNVSLMGMPKENDWILYAPYSDKSMLRNTVTYELGRLTGNYCTKTAYCELIINGEYKGIYILLEKIKKDKGRVNVATLSVDEIGGDDVSGGYIFRVDKLDEDYVDGTSGWTSYPNPSYTNAMDITYQYFYPKAEDLANEQRSYLKEAVTSAEENLIASDFDDPDIGYNQNLNSGSFVDFLLINEISKEVDKYRFSTYFHKKKDSKGGEIFAGPIWDFNLGYANVDYWDSGLDYQGWLYSDVQDNNWSIMFWWKRLMEDNHFQNLTNTRWKHLRQNDFSDENIMAILDSMTTYIDTAQQRNYVQWPIMGTYIWPNSDWENNDYNDEVAFFKNWLINRLDWMDNNMPGSELSPVASLSMLNNNAQTNVMEVKVNLSDDYFNHTILKSKHFNLNNVDATTVIDTVYFESASEATIAISYQDITASENATITIENKIINGFQDITTNSIIISSKKDISLAAASINIYSTEGQITVKCDRPDALPNTLSVFNTMGQLVGEYTIAQQHINNIPVTLDANIYLASIIVDGKHYTQHIMIR